MPWPGCAMRRLRFITEVKCWLGKLNLMIHTLITFVASLLGWSGLLWFGIKPDFLKFSTPLLLLHLLPPLLLALTVWWRQRREKSRAAEEARKKEAAERSNSPKSSVRSTTLLKAGGTSPLAMRSAKPSTTAVLPTPGSPWRRRSRMSTICRTSASRPNTGSILPARACAVRSTV